MDWLINFIADLGEKMGQTVKNAAVIALLFPIAMAISAFGHIGIGIPLLWVPILIGAVLAARLLHIHDVFESTATAFIVGIGLIVVASMGALDTLAVGNTLYHPGFLRYIGVIIGIAFAEGAVLVLAGIATGAAFTALVGVAMTPGLEFKDIPDKTQWAFQTFCITAFWFGIFGAVTGLAAPWIPYELALVLLILTILVVPGTLALAGMTSFKIVYYMTIAVFVANLVVALGYVLHSLGLLNPVVSFALRHTLWTTVGVAIVIVLILTFLMEGVYGLLTHGFWRSGLIIALGVCARAVIVNPAALATMVTAILKLQVPPFAEWQSILRGVVMVILSFYLFRRFWTKGLFGFGGALGLVAVPGILVWVLTEWMLWGNGGFGTIGNILATIWRR